MKRTHKLNFLAGAILATLPSIGLAQDADPFSGTFDYVGEVFSNVDGGIDTGTVYTGLAAFALDYSGGGWDWHMNLYAPHGSSVTDRYVGDFGVVSNIDAPKEVRLEEFWFQRNFDQGSLRFGLLAIDTEFSTSEYGGLFINGTFGAPIALAANTPNAPVYPLAALGVRGDWSFGEDDTFRMAVVDGDAGDPDVDNRHGTDIDLGDGALVIAEVEFSRPRDEDQAPDAFKLTGFYHTGDFIDTDGNDVSNNFGFTAIVDRAITDNIGWFGRVGYARTNRSLSPWHIETGINVFGAFGTEGVLGLGVAMIDLNEEFGPLLEVQGIESETIFEISYDYPINDWFTLQPDLQYIVNPGGVEGPDNALVVGLRGKLSFGF